MSASCPSLTKGLDGALLYERDVSFCCLHFTAAAGVVVPFSQVDAFSFCRKCIYVLNSRHVFCCCGYERGILLWRSGTLTLKCIWVKALHAAVIFPQQCFYLMTFGGHNVDIIKRESGAAAMRLSDLSCIYTAVGKHYSMQPWFI